MSFQLEQRTKVLAKLLNTVAFRAASSDAQFEQIKLAVQQTGAGDDAPVILVQLLIESQAIDFARVRGMQPSHTISSLPLISPHSGRSSRAWS